MNKIASTKNYKVVTASVAHKLSQIIKNLPDSKDLSGYIKILMNITDCKDKACEDDVINIMNPSLWHLTFDPKKEGDSSISLIKPGDLARITSALFSGYSESLGIEEANNKAENIATRILVKHSIIPQ